jgi:hypothetical protein
LKKKYYIKDAKKIDEKRAYEIEKVAKTINEKVGEETICKNETIDEKVCSTYIPVRRSL